MKQIVNRANYMQECNRIHEIHNKPSKTVPGMTLSIQELIKRYVVGGNVTTYQGVYLDEDTDIPVGFENMTELDRLAAAKEVGRQIDEFRRTRKDAVAPPVTPPTIPPTPPTPPPAVVESVSVEVKQDK